MEQVREMIERVAKEIKNYCKSQKPQWRQVALLASELHDIANHDKQKLEIIYKQGYFLLDAQYKEHEQDDLGYGYDANTQLAINLIESELVVIRIIHFSIREKRKPTNKEIIEYYLEQHRLNNDLKIFSAAHYIEAYQNEINRIKEKKTRELLVKTKNSKIEIERLFK